MPHDVIWEPREIVVAAADRDQPIDNEPLHNRIRLLSWLAMLSYREIGPVRPAANDFVGFVQMLQCVVVFTILKILPACHIFPMILDHFRVVRSIAVVYR